jgi:5-oxoprolinase (ATP-hydrolysing)
VAPFGLEGGLPGALGRQWIERADGRIEELPGCAKAELRPGDVFVIQTPGGGGFGAPESEAEADPGTRTGCRST